MNYGAFTNDSEVVRGALHADDTLKARGEEIRFRVRETAEWKKHAADLEMEMIKRGMIFEVINWSQGQQLRRPSRVQSYAQPSRRQWHL